MTNELKTRRLIVNLPNVSGEEADVIAAGLEEVLPIRFGRSITGTVTHALGEVVPNGIGASVEDGIVRIQTGTGADYDHLTPDEARQLAGALLQLAHDIDPTMIGA